MKRAGLWALAFSVVCACSPAFACDLCTINNANSAQRNTAPGFQLSVSELFVPARTEQFKSDEVSSRYPDYVDSSVTHVVSTYNFKKDFGISLNVPIIYRDFRRKLVTIAPNGLLGVVTDEGTDFGLGDVSLIGRWTAFRETRMKWSVSLNILGGVKLPTGDTDPIRDEAAQVRRYNKLVGPGHVHDALGIPVSSVHAHDVTLGSGSFDGIFGTALNLRYGRWLFENQIQYYLRTEGESTYQFGNELIVSGGPGAFLLKAESATLSLLINAAYETHARDQLFEEKSDHTGMTSWYIGPLFNFTAGKNFSANLGVDIPIQIANNGFQSVPDYRLHGGVGWRF